MPGSWVQHDTLVGPRLQREIGSLFRESEIADLLANKPFLIVHPRSAWFVHSGAVDLFLVRVAQSRAQGRRSHVARISAGELFLGIPTMNMGEGAFALLAVGVSGTKVSRIDQAEFRQRASHVDAFPALCAMVELWARRLLDALPRRDPPADIRQLYLHREALSPEVQQGPTVVQALPAAMGDGSAAAEVDPVVTLPPGAAARSGPRSIWVLQLEGTSKLVGVGTVEGRAVVLLSREAWLQATTEVQLRTIDSATFFKRDPEWRAVERFHRLIVGGLLVARAMDETGDAERFQERLELDRRSVHRSLLALAGEVEKRGPTVAEEDPLVAVCERVCKPMGIGVIAPPRADMYVGEARLEEIARASNFRTRAVLLEHGWWKEGGEPMVGFAGDESAPVGLLPRRFGGYEIYDPLTRSMIRANAKTAANLSTEAYTLYRALPARPLRAADLVSFAAKGNLDDLIMMLGAGVLMGVFGMAVPFATAELIDTIIPLAEVGLLAQTGAILAMLAFATAIVQIARGAATVRTETRSSSRLQAALWDRLLRLPVPFFRGYSAGDLATRATGINTIRKMVSGSTVAAVLGAVFSLLNLGIMFSIDLKLTLVAAALSLGSVGAAASIGLAVVYLQRTLAEADGRLASLVLEILGGIGKLKVAAAERRAFGVWSAAFTSRRKVALKTQGLSGLLAVFNSAYPAMMLLVLFAMVAGERPRTMSTGSFLSFNAAFVVFSASMVVLVEQGIELLKVIPIYERVRPIIEAVPEVDEIKAHPGDLKGLITVSRLSFRYSPESPRVLDGLDFEIEPGEFVAIVGSSGAGKSSVLRLLLGFEHPESGGVFYDRRDLATLDVVAVRRQIGVVLQNGKPISGSLLENILGARNLTVEDAWAAARMAGLAPDIEKMPMGIHTMVPQGGGVLSGGQRQRLMIAAALVTKPKIIFFDEATSALDNTAQAVVTTSLERLRATRIVIAHRLSTIRNADRIIVLQRGRVVQLGSYDALMEEEGVFRDIAARQIA